MFTIYNKELGDIAENIVKKNLEYFSGRWEKNNLEKYQEEGISKTLKYVKKNSEFYKYLLKNLSEEDINNFNLEKLTNIPFTTKEHLRNETINILSRPINECCFFYETTGTTGKATPCPRDYVDSIYTNAAITSCFETILKDDKIKHIVGVCGPTEVHSFGDTLGDVCKNMGLAIAKFWAYSPVIGIKKSIELLKELKITVLMCTPGMALTMAKFANKYGYDLKKDFKLEILMVTGELSSPAMIKNLENIWGVKAYNFLYGSMETSALAAVAKNGKLHTFPLNYLYEVIDPVSLNKVEYREGEEYKEGELVVSMLFQGSKPMIRYRTGDLVRMFKSNKGDILPSPVIQVLGRVHDTICLNNVRISAYDFEQMILEEVPVLFGYQVVIDSKLGKDLVEINIEPLFEDDFDEFNIKLEQRFKNYFNIIPKIIFSDLDAMTTTGAMVSWKAARIIDRRNSITKEDLAAKEIAKNRNLVLG